MQNSNKSSKIEVGDKVHGVVVKELPEDRDWFVTGVVESMEPVTFDKQNRPWQLLRVRTTDPLPPYYKKGETLAHCWDHYCFIAKGPLSTPEESEASRKIWHAKRLSK